MKKKVLIVDDTKNIRKLLSTCLEVEGYEVVTAADGQEAIDLIEQEPFDLIFLDIKMPEISGTEVLKRIRALKKDVPVIIMTAFATVKNAVECTKLGAVAYLQKPFTADKIKSVINELLGDKCGSDNIDSYLQRSRELISENKLKEAFDLLKKALSIDPSNGLVFNLIGKVYEAKGDNSEAQKFYNVSREFGYTE